MRHFVLSTGLLLALTAVWSGKVFAQTSPAYTAYAPVASSTTSQTRASSRNAPNSTLTVVPEDFSKLVLTPGFLLDLQVFDMPEISSEVRVDGNGDITVPLTGTVHVGGMTIPAAEEVIRQALIDKQILLDPKINLDVVQYAGYNVSVLGEVDAPSRFQLLAPHTLPEVLAMSGGETQLAGNRVLITRRTGSTVETIPVNYDRNHVSPEAEAFAIQPGDSILVPRAGIVYVLGGVNKPGGYIMQENGTLNTVEAISVASGTIMNAGMGGIRVVRKDPSGSLQTIPVPFRDITNGKTPAMNLQDGDILYVPISKFKTIVTAGIVAGTTTAVIYAIH